jgi:hypothetical protein
MDQVTDWTPSNCFLFPLLPTWLRQKNQKRVAGDGRSALDLFTRSCTFEIHSIQNFTTRVGYSRGPACQSPQNTRV